MLSQILHLQIISLNYKVFLLNYDTWCWHLSLRGVNAKSITAAAPGSMVARPQPPYMALFSPTFSDRRRLWHNHICWHSYLIISYEKKWRKSNKMRIEHNKVALQQHLFWNIKTYICSYKYMYLIFLRYFFFSIQPSIRSQLLFSYWH